MTVRQMAAMGEVSEVARLVQELNKMKNTKVRRLGIFSRSKKTEPLSQAEMVFMFFQMIIGVSFILFVSYWILSGFVSPWLR